MPGGSNGYANRKLRCGTYIRCHKDGVAIADVNGSLMSLLSKPVSKCSHMLFIAEPVFFRAASDVSGRALSFAGVRVVSDPSAGPPDL
jgi:hypothetical protein